MVNHCDADRIIYDLDIGRFVFRSENIALLDLLDLVPELVLVEYRYRYLYRYRFDVTPVASLGLAIPRFLSSLSSLSRFSSLSSLSSLSISVVSLEPVESVVSVASIISVV